MAICLMKLHQLQAEMVTTLKVGQRCRENCLTCFHFLSATNLCKPSKEVVAIKFCFWQNGLTLSGDDYVDSEGNVVFAYDAENSKTDSSVASENYSIYNRQSRYLQHFQTNLWLNP